MKRLLCLALVSIALATPLAAATPDMPKFSWQNFTTANGLPDDHVFSVLVDGDRVWAGTENGLAVYERGKWKVFRPSDGLAHRVVLSLALDKRTGDVWAGTMGGLSRVSAGRIDTFTQLNSGLANDIVYNVGVQGDFVWVATAAGASRLNTRTAQWSLFNERNTPMYEIWTYAVSTSEDKVYYAVWGGGVLEYDVRTERWCCSRTRGSFTKSRPRSATSTRSSGSPPTSARAGTTAATGITSSRKTAACRATS
jgi:frataxin-like iron-binding protein CyaY